MKFLKYTFVLIFLFLCLPGNAQKSAVVIADEQLMENGIQYYHKSMFKAAQISLEEAWHTMDRNSEQKEICHYYLTLSKVKLGGENTATLVADFLQIHPSNTLLNKLYLEIGNHYYSLQKYTEALKWLLQVSPKFTNETQEQEYRFKMGYTYLSMENYSEANGFFSSLTSSEKYAHESHYYCGYIAYLEEDFETAKKHFGFIKNIARYQKELAYYAVTIQFKQKNYTQAKNEGKKLLEIGSTQEVSEISKIIGESLFYLKKYKEAIPYLKKYRGKNNQLSTNDHYFLGYAYYITKDFQNAVLTFNKIVKGNDLVAQNAYYLLADAYLQLNKKTAALNAFKNCSELTFDLDLQEDALYNYAKLSYDIGNPYTNASNILFNYIKRYPKNKKSKTIHSLLIQSFVSSQDFQGALDHYKNTGLSKNAFYQKTSLNRGTQLFQNTKYEQAVPYFKSASTQTFDSALQSRGLYWLAESHYHLQQYAEALDFFKKFYASKGAKQTQEYKNIEYALAYSYFKLKAYSKSSRHFENFIASNSANSLKNNDSYVRLGDCHFISKNYWNAMEAYQKVIEKNGIDADYATFQKAISYGFVERDQRKIESLVSFSKLHPTSSYKDDALFELANAYLKTKQSALALATYQKLINTYQKSIYLPKALLKTGLIYFNSNEPNKAISQYKYIVKNYPTSKEAQEAIANARRVYIDIDKVEDYAEWTRKINHGNTNNLDLENAMYAAAENNYMKNKWEQAVASFEKYFTNFPNGTFLLKAHFYSGQANFQLKNKNKSQKHFAYVIAQKSNEYTEPSLVQLSKIHLENKNWDAAIPLLQRLENEANFPQNILFSKLNVMKGSFETQNYKQSIAYAQKVLKTKKSNLERKSDAHLYMARSYMKLNKWKEAEMAYQEVAKIGRGGQKAEALYFDAYFKNKSNAYERSNAIIQQLTAEYAAYKIWGVKGLILMAKNYNSLQDAFQATYILENIVKNYKQFPALVEEAQTILKNINANTTNGTTSN